MTQALASIRVAYDTTAVRKPELWPWYDKVRAELGRRGWPVAELARRLKMQDASPLRAWLHGKHAPREGVVAAIAKVLGWPHAYLNDEAQPYPPVMQKQWVEEILDGGLSDDALKVIGALPDPQKAAYLAKCVDQFDELRRSLRRE